MLRRMILSLSLANLCFYNVIFTLFYKNFFFMRYLPTTNSYLALIFSEIILALFFLLIWELIIRINKPWVTKTFKGLLCFLLFIIIGDAATNFKFINKELFLLGLLFVTIVLIWFKKTAKVAMAFITIAVPFIVLIFFQSLLGAVTHWNQNNEIESVNTLYPVNNSAPRVLWMIFDEMDYQVAFSERPKGFKLPAFDRFREQSVFAENAFAPSSKTIRSLPALIDGKIISEAEVTETEELMITYLETGETVPWGSRSNVFSKARELKINTALVGDYLPYSRLIGKDLSYCSWYSFFSEYTSPVDKLTANIFTQLRMLFAGPAKSSIQRENTFYKVLNDASELVANPAYGLIMIHFPIPHGPHFYKNHWWERSAKGYLNALELSDLTLTHLRQLMEDNGLWDTTTVIISSDHWLRNKKYFKYKVPDYRIPFLVKMPGQNKAYTYQSEFNTFITQDLILAILRGEVATPEAVIGWLDKNKQNPIKYQ